MRSIVFLVPVFIFSSSVKCLFMSFSLIYRDSLYTAWRRKWQPSPVFLPGEFHEQKEEPGCNPLGRKESDMSELLTLLYTVDIYVTNI